jgi:hypothetical protein
MIIWQRGSHGHIPCVEAFGSNVENSFRRKSHDGAPNGCNAPCKRDFRVAHAR